MLYSFGSQLKLPYSSGGGGGPAWRGHEPVGLTMIADQPFDSLPSNGWTNSGATIVADASGPKSPGNALKVLWPSGTPGGNGVGQAFRAWAGGFDTLYLCTYLKFSSGWQGGTTAGGDGYCANKILYPFPGGSNRFILEGRCITTGPLLVSIGLQNTVVPATSTFTNSSQSFNRGSWDLVEIVMQGNSASTADGFVKVYLNGSLAVQQLGIQWTAGAAQFTDQISFDPVWGTTSDTVPADQDIRWDHAYLSGA